MEWVQQQSPGWLVGVVAMTQRVVDAAPDQAKGWEKLGATQLLAGDAKASVATLRQACARIPDHGALHLQLVRCAMAPGQYDEALHSAGAALLLEPASRA